MIIKGRCKKCGHLFTWDEEKYSAQNHIVHCKACDAFLGGGLQCRRCKQVVQMLNGAFWTGFPCLACRIPYEEPMRDAI